MGDVTAILLAAGLSRRMGERNKLLLPINGVPMIRYMVEVYRAVTQRPILVVTGHQSDAIEDSLAGCDVRLIFNSDFADGQQTSVACGLRVAKDGAQILIGLGDQPRLTGDNLRALLKAHKAADPARISIPKIGDQRGNPIVVPSNLRERVLADPKSAGCKAFTRKYPERVQFHALSAHGFYTDVDTPDAYDALVSQNLGDAT
ncbi:nucleotidyltransferase family protein [Ruegeria hyattellae]|uniref:nucleotidyltransferase family protein n=1 Tax=Ruegeria hyattellae TaxID=3233337 RepID=UPI00355B1FD4